MQHLLKHIAKEHKLCRKKFSNHVRLNLFIVKKEEKKQKTSLCLLTDFQSYLPPIEHPDQCLITNETLIHTAPQDTKICL